MATRRRASERRSRPAACSAALAPRTSTPSVRAIAIARRAPSSGPSCMAPASTSTPHGASPPGIATTSSSVPMPSSGVASGSPGRAWTGRPVSSARANSVRPGGMLRMAVTPGPSASIARGTRPPGRRSQMPTSAAPVATRMRRQASSRAGSRPLGNEATSARSASRSSPAAVSVSVGAGSRRENRDGSSCGIDGPGDSAAAQEALQVTQPVAPVAPLVDPVVAEPARLAPRPDGVRVHAQDPGRLRDGEGGIARSDGDGGVGSAVGFVRHGR